MPQVLSELQPGLFPAPLAKDLCGTVRDFPIRVLSGTPVYMIYTEHICSVMCGSHIPQYI